MCRAAHRENNLVAPFVEILGINRINDGNGRVRIPHYGDAPNQVFFHGLVDDKNEFEADAFATVSICPILVLKGEIEFEEDSRFARKVRKDRDRIYFSIRFRTKRGF
jgi:hypothetical protein